MASSRASPIDQSLEVIKEFRAVHIGSKVHEGGQLLHPGLTLCARQDEGDPCQRVPIQDHSHISRSAPSHSSIEAISK